MQTMFPFAIKKIHKLSSKIHFNFPTQKKWKIEPSASEYFQLNTMHSQSTKDQVSSQVQWSIDSDLLLCEETYGQLEELGTKWNPCGILKLYLYLAKTKKNSHSELVIYIVTCCTLFSI